MEPNWDPPGKTLGGHLDTHLEPNWNLKQREITWNQTGTHLEPILNPTWNQTGTYLKPLEKNWKEPGTHLEARGTDLEHHLGPNWIPPEIMDTHGTKLEPTWNRS